MRERTSISKSPSFVALIVVLASAAIMVGQSSKGAIHRNDIDARINRIVDGLLPAAIIKGQPLATMTLADRMKYYHVPGVSLAFFDHGQVAWARGYGLAEAKTPVTTETLFQAASVSKSVTALAALRLVQDGKLNLDENVNLKLKSWKVQTASQPKLKR